MPGSFFTGQRWISRTEPELGLGVVVKTGVREIHISFPASGETRKYRKDNAPLDRVNFKRGDKIRDKSGRFLTVESVEKKNHLLYYLNNY